MLANSYNVIKCGFLSAIMIINLRTAFSQDHSNEKKVIFDISSWKKRRERSPNFKLIQPLVTLINRKN